MEKKKSFKSDIILISVLLCLALILGAVILLTRSAGSFAVVEIDGVEVGRYRLDKNAEYVLNNGTNILKIENGEAYLIYADCPDKTCVKTGKIMHVGESIICLPNKLSVVIRGSTSDGVDLVS